MKVNLEHDYLTEYYFFIVKNNYIVWKFQATGNGRGLQFIKCGGYTINRITDD